MNELIKTANNEQGLTLHKFLEKRLHEEIYKDTEIFISGLLEILLSEEDMESKKIELLKVGITTYDRFELVILDTFFEMIYLLELIDEDLTDNKRMPNGSDQSYGIFFENKIFSKLEKYINVKSRGFKGTDAIFSFLGIDYILEIKCGWTNAEEQINRYQQATGIERFITVNGHENAISFKVLDVYRMAKYLTALGLRSAILH